MTIDFNPYTIGFHNDPYPVYKRLRDEAPVYYHRDLNFYAISRFADVVAAHADDKTFSSASGVTIEGTEANSGSLIVKDSPEHRWHKALITKVFTRQKMAEMEAYIRSLCTQFLSEAAARDEFDFVNDFAVQLPLTVISEMTGIPEEFRHDIHHFANMVLLRGEMDAAEIHAAQQASDQTYAELIRYRRANPGDDPISLLMNIELEDDKGVTRKLTDEELAGRFLELAIAGHETVSKAIPNGAMAMQRFPSERRKLIDDSSLIDNAVEEVLRFDPPSQLQGRTTTKDVELHGITIPKGVRTMLLTGAATRDERKYEDPDRFDVSRKTDLASIYFGYGIHKCLGIHLARLELRIAFQEILRIMPNYELFPDRAQRLILSNVRGYSALPCAPCT